MRSAADVRLPCVFVDTSAFVALYAEKDKHRPRLLPEWKRLKGTKDLLVTSDVVVADTLSYLDYEAGVQVARRAGREIRTSPNVNVVNVTAADPWAALDFLRNFAEETPRRNDRPGYVDCTSLAVIRRLAIGAALVWDKHYARFSQRGGAHPVSARPLALIRARALTSASSGTLSLTCLVGVAGRRRSCGTARAGGTCACTACVSRPAARS